MKCLHLYQLKINCLASQCKCDCLVFLVLIEHLKHTHARYLMYIFHISSAPLMEF